MVVLGCSGFVNNLLERMMVGFLLLLFLIKKRYNKHVNSLRN